MFKKSLGFGLAIALAIPTSLANAQAGIGGTQFSPVPHYHLMQLEVDTSRVSADEFAARTTALRDCREAKSLAKQIGAKVKRHRFKRATTLPRSLQAVLNELEVGRSTQPFSNDPSRARVIVLCGRG